jgi:hypothetical protein
MSSYADIFVGGVAITLGLITLTSAVTPDHAVYQLPKIRWLAAQVGPSGARSFLVGLGILLVTLGFLIMLGWKWTWESDREQSRVPTRTGRAA